MHIGNSISSMASSKTPQLLAHMPEVNSTRGGCAYCSTQEREKRINVICSFCGVCLCVKDYFLLYCQDYMYQK